MALLLRPTVTYSKCTELLRQARPPETPSDGPSLLVADPSTEGGLGHKNRDSRLFSKRRHVQSDIGDEVFLSADKSAFTDGEKNCPGVETILLGCGFGMAQEA